MMQHFGKSKTVNISQSGTIPLIEGPRPSDTPLLLGLLGNDNFWTVVGSHVGNKSVLKVIVGKLIVAAVIEHQRVTKSNTFPKSQIEEAVALTPICDDLVLKDFFDTKDKAEAAVGNVMRGFKIARKSLYEDNQEFAPVLDLWDIICINGSSRSHVHNYLRSPSGAPPVVKLFGDYDLEKLEVLSIMMDQRNHASIVKLVAADGILTERLIRYLYQIRLSWVTNRLSVAHKYRNEETVTTEDLNLNKDLCEGIGITSRLGLTLISKK